MGTKLLWGRVIAGTLGELAKLFARNEEQVMVTLNSYLVAGVRPDAVQWAVVSVANDVHPAGENHECDQ